MPQLIIIKTNLSYRYDVFSELDNNITVTYILFCIDITQSKRDVLTVYLYSLGVPIYDFLRFSHILHHVILLLFLFCYLHEFCFEALRTLRILVAIYVILTLTF